MIDRSVILAIVYMLGGIAIVLVSGLIYASVSGKVIDAGISALAGSVIGYLGGILTNVARTINHEPGTTIRQVDELNVKLDDLSQSFVNEK